MRDGNGAGERQNRCCRLSPGIGVQLSLEKLAKSQRQFSENLNFSFGSWKEASLPFTLLGCCQGRAGSLGHWGWVWEGVELKIGRAELHVWRHACPEPVLGLKDSGLTHSEAPVVGRECHTEMPGEGGGGGGGGGAGKALQLSLPIYPHVSQYFPPIQRLFNNNCDDVMMTG